MKECFSELKDVILSSDEQLFIVEFGKVLKVVGRKSYLQYLNLTLI